MSIQMTVVGLIVLACAVQAAWTLMPAKARTATAIALLKLPLRWPAFLSTKLKKAAGGASSGCGGCDSCGSVKPDVGDGIKPITIHRRTPQ